MPSPVSGFMDSLQDFWVLCGGCGFLFPLLVGGGLDFFMEDGAVWVVFVKVEDEAGRKLLLFMMELLIG